MVKVRVGFLIVLGIFQTALSNPSCPEIIPGMTNVHLVCHTHDDVGWLKTVDQYYYGSNKDITWVGVQYILDSVVASLLRDSSRKFIYVESAFFYRWWNEQNDQMKNDVVSLVDSGQLEFIGGGWSMSDEAGCHYNAFIDQMTLGLARLNETFGPAAIPRIAWQIDPFGHSREHASLFAQMGMDGLFFSRLDYNDKDNRWDTKQMEMVWEASNSLGEDSWLFTGVLPNHYSPPSGFCFDILCNDDPIMDDPSLEDYNKDEMVDNFLTAVADELTGFATSNIIMTMGEDFHYVNAEVNFKNTDKLIRYVNDRQANGSNVNVFYSTPSCYLDSLHDADIEWPTKTDDFFPYASDPHAYWTGYFTSRPTFKGFIRQSNNLLQAVKQISALTGMDRGPSLETLAEALAVSQHHDGVTGTAKQHVTDDYYKRLAKGVDAATDILTEGLRSFVLSDEAFPRAIETEFCPLLNISACPPTETSLSFVVNVYNPIGRPISSYVRIPVAEALAYEVIDGSDSNSSFTNVSFEYSWKRFDANYELVFYAENLPPLSIEQFLVNATSTEFKETPKRNLDLNPESDTTITKGNIKLTFDAITKKLKSVSCIDKALEMNVEQNFMYYKGMAGDNSDFESRASGAYIFRPDGEANNFTDVVSDTVIYEGSLVTEIQQEWSSWVTQVMRIYENKTYIEIEWLVGPISIDDGVGKEIINRIYWEDIESDQTFYTDGNGREMQKRVKDYRETWDFSSSEPVSQNYYPVTSRIIVTSTDESVKAAVMNDRAQGGSSLNDGEVELMVHRRLLYDDAFGVGEALNEKAFLQGLVARGRHFLVHSAFDTVECDFGCQHRTLGEELLLQPVLTFSSSSSFYMKSDDRSQKSGLSSALPDNIHLLTLEPWGDSKWLLRLENFYEVGESIKSATTSVDIQNLFSEWVITDIEELTLGANQLKEDSNRLQWNTIPDGGLQDKLDSSEFDEPLNEYSFAPMQIRTFIVTVAASS